MSGKKYPNRGPGSKNRPDQLTALEARCVLLHKGSDMEAYEAAGGKNAEANANRLFRRPRVMKALQKKQDAMLQSAGKQMARGVSITRNDIINRLDTISQKAESESARVSALGHLVNIFGLNPKHADTDLFAGWTDEELEHYRETGELPARFGPSLGPSGSDSGDSDPQAQ